MQGLLWQRIRAFASSLMRQWFSPLPSCGFAISPWGILRCQGRRELEGFSLALSVFWPPDDTDHFSHSLWTRTNRRPKLGITWLCGEHTFCVTVSAITDQQWALSTAPWALFDIVNFLPSFPSRVGVGWTQRREGKVFLIKSSLLKTLSPA